VRRALAVLTALLLAGAGVAGYARAQLADREAFSARAVSALDREEVRTALATRVVDQVAQSVAPDVLAVRPLLVRAVAELAGTPPLRRAVGTAAASAHAVLLDGESTYVVALSPSSPVVEDALRSVSPRVARALPDDLRLEVVAISPNDRVLDGARALADVADWWWPLCIAAVLAAVALAATARSARDAVATLGAAVLAAGLTVAAAVTVLGLAVAQTDDDDRREVRRALWDAFAGDLRTTAILAALAGAVTVAAASAAGGPDPLSRAARAMRPALRSARPAARAARAAALAALGVGLILAPERLVTVTAVVAGAVLVLLAARQLWPEAPARHPGDGRVRSGRLLALAVAAPVAAAAAALLLVLPSPATAPAESAGEEGACNGSVDLCDRRLNEVVFPATHNSYAAADEPGWLFANQRHGIARQLRDGIRAMLIDIHYGVPDPRSDRVRTDLRAEGSSRSKVARELSPAALRAADRLVTRVGGPLTGERRPYLCHTLCELGAEPLGEQLRLIRDFLASRPRETLILFVEPYVAVEEIERELDDAGLLDQAAELRRDEPLPTLGELVDAGTRLIVLSEEDGGSRPWYLPGFSFAQDTPLGARTPGDLRCTRFRGDADSPLFLVNHWIDTFPPSPSRNERIGGDFLRDRLERCGRARGLVPNMPAVDFYERTGVVELAAQLNR
jgi:hypothetical protein